MSTVVGSVHMGFDDNRFHRYEKKNGFERALKHFIAEARKAKAE